MSNWSVPTNIILGQGERGVCSVCNREETLVGRDRTTGMRVCRECLHPLAQADVWLTAYGPQAGICHPQPAVPPTP